MSNILFIVFHMYNKRYQNLSKNAFTLIEMLIVLIIMWILLMFTAFLSWEQIQKVKNKSVKESILSEWQSRYSKNLWSSSYAWIMYTNMDISIASGDNKFDFNYAGNDTWINNSFTDKFSIRSIVTDDWDGVRGNIKEQESITVRFHPYQMYCEWWNVDSQWNIDTSNMKDTLIIVARINNHKYYCFEIEKNNCRLHERDDCNSLIPNNE